MLGVNADHWGAMADFFTCHERQAFRLDSQVDPAIGLFAEPLAVALHAVNLMRPAKEAILGIVGAGTIGLAVLVVLRDFGFESIFIIDRIEEKLEMARALGAKTIQADHDQPLEVIADQTGGRRANGVFEAVGLAETVRTAYDLCDFVLETFTNVDPDRIAVVGMRFGAWSSFSIYVYVNITSSMLVALDPFIER